MRRFPCVLLLAVLGVTEFVSAAQAAETSRPNIVFVLVDDLRWDALGCTGHPFIKTPHIDRIAKEGALFKNFFVTIPLCSPSRSAFLTGQYVHKNGVTTNGNNSELSHRLITWPRLLHDAGYATAYVGKWHMGNDDSPRPGFDRWVSFKGQGQYVNPALNIDGKPVQADGYMTDLLSDFAVEFVKKPHGKPFALYLAHKAVHGPFTPADRHKNLYVDDKYTPRPNVGPKPAVGSPALRRNEPPEGGTTSEQKVKKKKKKADAAAGPRVTAAGAHDGTMRNQLRCVASIDEGVGRLLKTLEETKQLENTMFIFTSDNGYFWGEHGLGDKRAAYEESIRDPFLVRYPKLVKPGTTVEQFALNIDVGPTFLDLAGMKVPETMHGRSLLPLFKGDAANWRTSFLSEYFEERGRPDIKTWQAVRTDRWKYVHYPAAPAEDQLFDLQSDPYEMKNALNDPAAKETLGKLKAELAKLLEATK